MDILIVLIMGAFYTLFVTSIVRYLRHRQPLELAVVLVFSSTAALFAITVINPLVPALAPILGPLGVTMLVAQPALMIRLVGLIVPLPSWLVPLAFAGFVASVAWFYGSERSVPAILFLVGYFTLTETLAAVLLIREGRRRLGIPRVRLATAGVASLLFGAAVLIAGLASAARGGDGPADPAVTAVSRLLALVAGGGYLVAFSAPAWLRRLGQRSLAWDLVQTIVARPAGEDTGVLWRALASAAESVLGTPRIAIELDGTAASDATTANDAIDPGPQPVDDRRVVVAVPLAADGTQVGTLRAHLDGRSLFLEDDLALVGLLGSLTVRAVQREQAIADLADAQRAIREAETVRASEARVRALLDAEPNAMLSVNSAGVIQWCTRTAERMFDADDGGLVGRRLDELVPQPKGSSRLTGDASEVARYETTGRRGGGATFPAEVAISPLEFDGVPATLAVISDITWRYEAERIRDRFIGVLSHELRTPITSIFGGAQVLLKRWDGLEAETRAELISDVAGEAERLQRMVENLLVLARVEQGADLADVSPVLLQRLVPAVAAREGTSWPAMDLEVAPFEDLPPVAADDASISLILRNLISNACKYAGPSATVRVLVEHDGPDAVAVRVRDDGPGLDADDQDQLFRLYFRSSAADAVPGSGIGLFVCRELVVAMGGRIWATATPGGGAEFGFTLPVYTEAAPVESIPREATLRLRESRGSTSRRSPAPTT
ncbi:hypothetical protein BH20CHL7_BH20CHL7_19160 [soil metagenome]